MIPTKICGITNIEDALCAAQNGAAAVGFIFYPASSRYVQPETARRIIESLPQSVAKVGVFVNETAGEVKRIFDYCGLDMMQFHGDESPDYCRKFPAQRIIKALELRTEEDLKAASLFAAAAVLADSRHAGLYGGTGRKAKWDLARRIRQPLILSGGLNEENVIEGLRTCLPAALDVNSSVEERPGKKDCGKIARLLLIIKTETGGRETQPIFTRRGET